MIARCASLSDPRRHQSLHDQLIGAVRRHGEERAADQPRPHRVRIGHREGEVEHARLSRRARARPDRRPAARHQMAEDHERRGSAAEVDPRLEQLGPHHRLHAALVRVDDREHAEQQHRDRHHVRLVRHRRTDDQRDGNGGREHAHRIGERSRHHEHDRREPARREPEARLEQRVRGDQIARRSSAAGGRPRRRTARRCSRRRSAGIPGRRIRARCRTTVPAC